MHVPNQEIGNEGTKKVSTSTEIVSKLTEKVSELTEKVSKLTEKVSTSTEIVSKLPAVVGACPQQEGFQKVYREKFGSKNIENAYFLVTNNGGYKSKLVTVISDLY